MARLKKINITILSLIILLLLLVSCTTRTVIIDDKDDYIECVKEGIDTFKFSAGGQWGESVRNQYNSSFKLYSDKVFQNCMTLYGEEVKNED